MQVDGGKSNFLDHWTYRIERRAIRDLAGYGLDYLNLLPDSFIRRLKRFTKPRADRLLSDGIIYEDFWNMLKKGYKPMPFTTYFRRLAWEERALSVLGWWQDGHFFAGLARLSSRAYSWVVVINKSSDSKDPWSKTIFETIKLTAASEFGEMGFEVGKCISKRHGSWTGLIMMTLFAALSDKALSFIDPL